MPPFWARKSSATSANTNTLAAPKIRAATGTLAVLSRDSSFNLTYSSQLISYFIRTYVSPYGPELLRAERDALYKNGTYPLLCVYEALEAYRRAYPGSSFAREVGINPSFVIYT